MTFSGFDDAGLGLLSALSDPACNDRGWFEAHRADYERGLLTPAKAFVAALGPHLQTLVPGVQFAPKVNGSIFRINRDTRFSKDKRPYKDHLDFFFWVGESHRNGGGFFMRLRGDTLGLGAGLHGFDKATLQRWRDEVLDEVGGAAIEAALAAAVDAGFTVGEPDYKRVPRGLDPAHPRADLLRHKSVHAFVEAPHTVTTTPGLVAHCVAVLEPLVPLVQVVSRLLARPTARAGS